MDTIVEKNYQHYKKEKENQEIDIKKEEEDCSIKQEDISLDLYTTKEQDRKLYNENVYKVKNNYWNIYIKEETDNEDIVIKEELETELQMQDQPLLNDSLEKKTSTNKNPVLETKDKVTAMSRENMPSTVDCSHSKLMGNDFPSVSKSGLDPTICESNCNRFDSERGQNFSDLTNPMATSLEKNSMCKNSLQCSECNFVGLFKSRLIEHVRIHTGEKPFKCNDCDYSSSQKSHLKDHIRIIHTGEKPFKCNLCDYSATYKRSLKNHMRVHTGGEKPFKCRYCDYSASDNTALKLHVRTHTGEKPYKCSECDYSANQRSNLKSHIRTHTGEKPFKCSECDYSASHNQSLKIHIRSHRRNV